MIDPNGEDDFFVFRPDEMSSSRAWQAIQAGAKNYGNTVHIYNLLDEGSVASNYSKAINTPGAHVIFSGHTIQGVNGREAGVLFSDYLGVGDPGTTTTPNLLTGKVALTPVVNPTAADVAICGCNSNELASQYSSTTFTGVSPSQIQWRMMLRLRPILMFW